MTEELKIAMIAINKNTWLNNENCIEIDKEDHFLAGDDQESYDITISKEKVHE